MTSTYTTQDAVRYTDLGRSMIHYLCRQGILTPSGQGSRGRGHGVKYRFTFSDLILMKTFSYLFRHGISVKKLKEAHKTWSRTIKSNKNGFPSRKFLVTDGKNILFFDEKSDVLVELNNDGQMAFRFVLDISLVRQELEEKIRTAGRRP
jgi:DNA-binding transcriptional MerR regulator